MKFENFIQTLLFLLPLSSAAPTRRESNPPLRGTESLVGYSPSEKVAAGSKPDIKYSLLTGQKTDPDIGGYLDFKNVENPQPIRGATGGDDPGPRMSVTSCLKVDADRVTGNYYYDRINSDKLAPPGTDNGQTINAQWPMGKLTSVSRDLFWINNVTRTQSQQVSHLNIVT